MKIIGFCGNLFGSSGAARGVGLVPTGRGPSAPSGPAVCLSPRRIFAWLASGWATTSRQCSGDHQLVAEHETGRMSRAGVDMLNAAQDRLIILQSTVSQTAGEKLHDP